MPNKSLKEYVFFLTFIFCLAMANIKANAATDTVNSSQAGPLNVATGDTVNVTGTGNLASTGNSDGVSGSGSNNVVVTVANGGRISSQGDEVSAGDAGKAIDLGTGANVTISQGGTVYNAGYNAPGDDEHAAAIYTGTGAMVNISGTAETDDILGGGYNHFSEAVDTGSGSTITVSSTGLILDNAYDATAVLLKGSTTLNNSGTINSSFIANTDIGAVSAPSNNNIVNNNGTIRSGSSYDAVLFGTGSSSTGNVLNLYGNGTITGSLRNDGAVGGATVDFGYNGTTSDSSANDTINGSIGGNGGQTWDAHAYAGKSTINGTSAFRNVQIDSGATLVSTGNSTATGNFTDSGILKLNGIYTLSVTGTYTQNNGSTLGIVANSAASYSSVITSSAAVLSSGSSVNVTDTGYLPNNATLTVINTQGNGLMGGVVPGTVTTQDSFLTFSASDKNNNLVLTVDRSGIGFNSVGTNFNAKNVGMVLDNVNNPSSNMSTVLNTLEGSSASQVSNSLNSFSPNLENAIPQVTKAAMDQFVLKTLSHSSDNAGATGVSTGSDMLKDFSVWAEGFGGELHQEAQDLSNGYDASIGGFILGVEKEISDLWKVGFSQAFSQENIHGKDFSDNTDADSYQSSIYAKFDKAPYYVDTAFTYGYNRYDNSRLVDDAGANLTAFSRIDGQQYSTYIEGGYELNKGNLQITPLASFEYMKLDLPGYNESGAGALDLNVDSQDYNFAQTGFGFKLGYPIPLQSFNLLPEFKFKWLHDWVGDAQETTASFTGGGASFNTVGFTPDRNTYEFGGKLTIFTKGNVTISLNYDFDLRKDFYSNIGYVNVKYSF